MKRIKNYKLFLESFDDENLGMNIEGLKQYLFKTFKSIFDKEKIVRFIGEKDKIQEGADSLIDLLSNIFIDSVNANESLEEESKNNLILEFINSLKNSRTTFIENSFKQGIEVCLEEFMNRLIELKKKQDSEGEEWRQEKETSYDDMTNSEIQNLIDKALDERDFDKVKILSQYLKESFVTDEIVEAVKKFCEILLDFVISNNYVL